MSRIGTIVDAVKKGLPLGIDFRDLGVNSKGKTGKIGPAFSLTEGLKVARNRIFHKNPIQPNTADIVNWMLYDRITFAPLATLPNLIRLFVAPIGAGVKTKVDTNLDQVSRLSDPQWFNCTGLGFYLNADAAPVDIEAFLASEYMEFWVCQKVYLEGPVQCFPAGAGPLSSVSMSLVAAATAYSNATTNGWPNIHNLYDTRLPAGLNLGMNDAGQMVQADGLIGITILQGQSFHVELKADGGGATLLAGAAVTPILGVGLTIGCYLHGILSRGVQ